MLHRCRLALPLALAMTTLMVSARAQKTPIDELRDLIPPAQGQANDSEAVKKLDAAIATMTAASSNMTKAQVRQAAQYLLHGQMPERACRIAKRGLKTFANDPDLLELLGMTEFSQCQTVRTAVEMRHHAREAIKAFDRALAAGATTPTCRLLPWQGYIINAQCDKALTAIDALIADKSLQQMMPDRHLARGMALLGDGQYKLAAAELTHADMGMQVRMGTEGMAARAEAMAGRRVTAIKRSKGMWTRRKDPMSLGLYVDTLAFAGKHDDALKLLQDNPVVALPGEPTTQLAQRKQSRATFEYLISLRGKATKDLREQLAKHLGHTVKLVGPDLEKMANSPLLLGDTVRKAPSSPKGWGNDLLLLACVAAAEDYVPSELEKQMTAAMFDDATNNALRGAGAKARALQLLRAVCMRDDFEGCLVALQIGLQL